MSTGLCFSLLFSLFLFFLYEYGKGERKKKKEREMIFARANRSNGPLSPGSQMNVRSKTLKQIAKTSVPFLYPLPFLGTLLHSTSFFFQVFYFFCFWRAGRSFYTSL